MSKVRQFFGSDREVEMRRVGVSWASGTSAIDAETVLLDDREEKGDLGQVLYQVLVEQSTEVSSVAAKTRRRIEMDLRKWFRETPVTDPLVWWLKVYLEALPVRVFIATERFADEQGNNPADDEFWFSMLSNGDFGEEEERRESESGLSAWSSYDPRRWKGPGWRRFLGKRICWLNADEVDDVIVEIESKDERLFFESYFKGFGWPTRLETTKVELFTLWLRLRWVDHLARRTRGLDWAVQGTGYRGYGGLRVALDLKTPDRPGAYRPVTIPRATSNGQSVQSRESEDEEARSAEDRKRRKYSRIVLRRKRRTRGGWTLPGVELDWSEGEKESALAAMQHHTEFFGRDTRGRWIATNRTGLKAAANGAAGLHSCVVFAGSLSGALPSHNSLSVLLREAGGSSEVIRFLGLLEHMLVRVVVSDERFQSWWSSAEERATNAMQRRVFAAFWGGVGRFKQGPPPKHGFWGVIDRSRNGWRLSLGDGSASGTRSFLEKVFGSERGGVAAEAVIVHQGILDKWERESGIDLVKELCDAKDEFPWIFVTSGRGKPARVPVGTRFLPLSGLQACLVGHRIDKLFLIRQISSCGGEV